MEKKNRVIFNKIKYPCILIIVVCLIDGVYLQINHMSNVDEFTSLAVPIVLAGFDWSDILSTANFHGYGITILLTPFISMINDAVVLYKVALGLILLIRCVAVVITYKIVLELSETEYYKAAMIALVCNFGALSPSDSAELSVLQEIPMAFISILTVYWFIRYIKTKKIRYLIEIAVICTWGITIHSRVLLIFVALAVMVIEYLIKERNKYVLRDVLLFAIIFVFFYFFINCLNDGVINEVYESQDKVLNSYSAVASKVTTISRIFDFEKNKIVLLLFLSLTVSTILYSFGFLLFFVYANFWYIGMCLKKKVKVNQCLLSMIIFGNVSFWGMNFAIALQGVGSIVQENYKFLTYIRYAKPFLWIIVISGLVIIAKYTLNLKKTIAYSISILVICYKWFRLNTVSILKTSGYEMDYTCFNRYIFDLPDCEKYFDALFILSLFSLFFVLLIEYILKNKNAWVVVYMCLSLTGFVSIYNYFVNRDINYEVLCDASKKYISNLDDEDCDIYYVGSSKYCMYLRMALYMEDIQYIADMEGIYDLEGEFMVFTDTQLDLDNGCSWRALDENEYVYYR